MVSSKLFIITILALVPLNLIIYECDGASYPSGSHAEIAAFGSEKVNLSVYYDSLNQPCANFIVKNLQEIFNNGLINIVNLQLFPWASSHVNKSNNSIICQNGPEECEVNSLESCALNVWKDDMNKYYGLIYCVEFLAIEGRTKNWTDCISQLGLPKEPILNCYNRGNGTELGQKYIYEISLHYTEPLKFLPWVVVNNQSIGKEYENFTSYVCKAYRGSVVPETCNLR